MFCINYFGIKKHCLYIPCYEDCWTSSGWCRFQTKKQWRRRSRPFAHSNDRDRARSWRCARIDWTWCLSTGCARPLAGWDPRWARSGRCCCRRDCRWCSSTRCGLDCRARGDHWAWWGALLSGGPWTCCSWLCRSCFEPRRFSPVESIRVE